MTLHLLPPVATPDVLPLRTLRPRRPVLHRVPMPVIEAVPSSRDHAPVHRYPMAQRGQSSPCAMAVLDVCARATPFTRTPRARRSRAAVEMLEPFTESGELLPPAPKAMVTVPRPSIESQPGNLESVGSSVSIAVGSDGVVSMKEAAYRVVVSAEVNPMPGAVSVSHGADTCTPNLSRQFVGNCSRNSDPASHSKAPIRWRGSGPEKHR